jgi:hypothetical protein
MLDGHKIDDLILELLLRRRCIIREPLHSNGLPIFQKSLLI